ncbi:Lysophospholipid acyltransferase [Hypsizygus marmoreus]|uniref:Lysophospholipid acyltransferase n=1 Tax=Hypsizygus marmoreus TaxID=39966 RepID=A0A369JF38_HYPMA|nr:Lysophospholipid acyltransferase [Hypsizygus marmoreus]
MLSRCAQQCRPWQTYQRPCRSLHVLSRNVRQQTIPRPTAISKPSQQRRASSFSERNAVGVFTPKSAAIFIAAGVGLFFYFRYEKAQQLERREQERASKSYGRPQLGGPFSLLTPDGQPFTEQNLLGKWSLVYFGFTNCPDICPEELDKVTAVLDVIEKDHGKIFQPVFISVDPARDTPARVGQYLKDFHSSFVGLVGSYEATKAVCKAYRVYFSTPPNADPNGDYLVDHSIFVYLMDPQGKFVEAFGQSVQKEDIIEKIGETVEEWKAETGSKNTPLMKVNFEVVNGVYIVLGISMDALFQPLADLVGASVDQIKLIFCLLIAYPLGSIFIRIPSSQPALRHLFSITVALFFFFPVLRLYSAFFQLLASILGTYYIARYDQTSRMPWIVFVFVMGHLTINHIIRAMYELSYETMEVTGPQMVLTMKLTTFAWNVWDGRRPAEDLDKWQKEKRITEYPSLLEFLGYAFYFPGILVGPYLDLTEYRSLISETMFQDEQVKSKVKPGRNLPTGRKRVAYRKMFMGLVYLGLFVFLGGSNNYATALTPWFLEHTLFVRIALFQIYGFLERSKYYAIWTLTEGASIVTGLGFTGFSPSGKSLWEGAANVKVLDIEFPPNFKLLLDSWNMKTNIWLRECVYKRVTPKGKKPGFRSSMITFFTSAFWHGIASGYYLTFLMGGFITTAARLARNNIRPLLLPAPGQPPSDLKEVYDLLGMLLSTMILNYAASPFMLLTASSSITVWTRLGYYGHIIIGGALVFFYAGGTHYLRTLQADRGILHAGKKPAGGAKAGVADNGDVSGTTTPILEKTFTLPPTFDEVIPPQK